LGSLLFSFYLSFFSINIYFFPPIFSFPGGEDVYKVSTRIQPTSSAACVSSFWYTNDPVFWLAQMIWSFDWFKWFRLLIGSNDLVFWLAQMIQTFDWLKWFSLLIGSKDSVFWLAQMIQSSNWLLQDIIIMLKSQWVLFANVV